MPYRKTFGVKFRQLLDKEGLNPNQAAKKLKVGHQWVSRIVKDDWVPPRDKVLLLIKTFDLPRTEWLESAGYLVGGKETFRIVAERLEEIAQTASNLARELSQLQEESA